MKNKETIGVAFLGVGRMGETHLRNLTAISGIKVVVVADLILERAARGREITGAELAVTDSAKAIEHPAVDAVVIVFGIRYSDRSGRLDRQSGHRSTSENSRAFCGPSLFSVDSFGAR